tara:strand:- start:3682 stop:4365 length:684 start_codon:yes stop_codon:yes gene_type:complete
MGGVNRFDGAVWYENVSKLNVMIVGVGATGSYAALFASRLGIKSITLIDPDKVEFHNGFSQLFQKSDIGQNKVEAIKKLLFNFTGVTGINNATARVENMSDYWFNNQNVIFSTTDSMVARKYTFEKAKELPECLFLDSRISAELWEVYCVPMNDKEKIQRYEETLFGENQGSTGACNYQQSSHSAAGAAIKMTELITNWETNKLIDEDYLPFSVKQDIRNQIYECNY